MSMETFSSHLVTPKPITRPPARAKTAARQKLAEALVARFGHDETTAATIARARG